MKVYLILLVILCMGLSHLYAQKPLSELPEKERNEILVDIAQTALKENYPKWYRKNIRPVIVPRVFTKVEDQKKGPLALPDYVKNGDIFYMVYLYYDKWYEEKFEYEYTARVLVVDKTREALSLHLGGCNLIYSLLKKKKK